jgi:hypothetical protein
MDKECGGRGSKYKGQNTLIANLKSPISPTRALAARGLTENHFSLTFQEDTDHVHISSCPSLTGIGLIRERDGGVGLT